MGFGLSFFIIFPIYPPPPVADFLGRSPNVIEIILAGVLCVWTVFLAFPQTIWLQVRGFIIDAMPMGVVDGWELRNSCYLLSHPFSLSSTLRSHALVSHQLWVLTL